MKIVNRHTSELMLEIESLSGVSLRGVNLGGANLNGVNLSGSDLYGANLYGADLSSANLRGANLYGANLSSADLRGAVGNMREVRSVQLDTWPVAYTNSRMQIGCQNHSIETWWAFTATEILSMASNALDWWIVWKPVLRAIVAAAPATPCKENDA